MRGSSSVGPASPKLGLPHIQRFMERGARLVKKALVEPANFADPRLLGSYLPLVHKLAHVRHQREEGGMFTFTSVSSGDGVSYVIDMLACELAGRANEQVLVAPLSGLNGLNPVDVRILGEHADPAAPKVWRLEGRRTSTSWPAPFQNGRIHLHPETLKLLRQKFGYILVDCPALNKSGAVLTAAPASDGVILIVAAGQATRGQIEQARNLLDSSGNLLGLILNKRTYPVPGFLYRNI